MSGSGLGMDKKSKQASKLQLSMLTAWNMGWEHGLGPLPKAIKQSDILLDPLGANRHSRHSSS
jgi:hypothetical protein